MVRYLQEALIGSLQNLKWYSYSCKLYIHIYTCARLRLRLEAITHRLQEEEHYNVSLVGAVYLRVNSLIMSTVRIYIGRWVVCAILVAEERSRSSTLLETEILGNLCHLDIVLF